LEPSCRPGPAGSTHFTLMKRRDLWDLLGSACGVQLAAELLHEINNSLTRILASLPLTLSTPPEIPNEKAEWESIPKEIICTRRSIDSLLRLLQAPTSCSPPVIEMNHLIDILLTALEVQPRFTPIRVRRNLSHPAPTVKGDFAEWWALLLTLILCASRFLPPGATIEICTSSEEGGFFRLSIQTFPGSDSTPASVTSPVVATGLFTPGCESRLLRMARKAARRAGGSLTYTSARWGGINRVSFLLPLATR
jgi:hypothetical protein